jgi:cobalt/nickel transport system ATP-binding protein
MTDVTQTAHDADRQREAQAALAIAHLRFAYPKREPIFADLSLEIQSGERVGLIGPNGSGKTTLFNLIGGILKFDDGDIQLFGQSLDDKPFHSDIGLVFQNPDDQLFTTAVRDDVAFGPKNMGLSPEKIDHRVQQALAATGVEELIDRVPQNLSGGEKTMVAIATVLAMQPRLILYDEPSASLDLRSRRHLIEFLQDSQETIVISTHDLELVLEVCDRVLLLDEGRIVADDHPADVMANAEFMQTHGLEKPHSLTHAGY